MKLFFIFLLVPVLSIGQTVHVKDESIVYEGKEKIQGVSASEMYVRIQKILPSIAGHYKIEKQTDNFIKLRGKLKLKTPYNIIRTVPYSMEITITDGGYEYLIDSVSFTEKIRGEKTTVKSSKEVYKNMSEAGPIVGDTEKILNETDMQFQRLLDLLKRGLM